MITFHDIQTARERIRDLVIKTPLLTSDRLNDKLGFRLFVKAEPLQRIGAFKFRGACNALCNCQKRQIRLSPFQVAIMHRLALVARLTGRHATIIMPEDAPKAKIEATKSYGADVVLYDRYSESREEIGDRLTKEWRCVGEAI